MTITGLVLTHYSNYYYVQASDGRLYQCFVRALLKKEQQTVLVGDRVTLQPSETASSGQGITAPTAWITAIAPRTSMLTRPKIANVTQVLVVHPVSPSGLIEDLLALDRTLLHIQLTGLPVAVCLSKVDLLPAEAHTLKDWCDLYGHQLGYPVLTTSIHQSNPFTQLTTLLHDQITVLAGVSGAGKSSLLNALCPDWQLKTAEQLTRLGSHTTRHVQLLAHDDGWVADTPGFRLQSFDTTDPALLAKSLPEAKARSCAFDDCLHLEESGCAVRDLMTRERYAHYRQFQTEAEAYSQTVLATSQKQEAATKTLQRSKTKQVHIARLHERNRAVSRRKQKQSDWLTEDDNPSTPTLQNEDET